MYITCVECGRQFDLFNPADVEEWTAGHDCEPMSFKSERREALRERERRGMKTHDQSIRIVNIKPGGHRG